MKITLYTRPQSIVIKAVVEFTGSCKWQGGHTDAFGPPVQTHSVNVSVQQDTETFILGVLVYTIIIYIYNIYEYNFSFFFFSNISNISNVNVNHNPAATPS